ncbi:hypothetical protein GR183_01125 [Stappia sp. GBMRC 2046]|uniref:Uncharacterized protein n=1 Tax=Stappia sediminis TaxID=2692190 RepID=A0A7X3S5U5_9HYPH|nr:hypothetical protein [Stappia sediminis]MXN63493.1 hypothetical protein [Stappia sediminis]
MGPEDADIGIKIEFDRGNSDPIKVFTAMSEMLSAFHRFDELFFNSIDPNIKPIMVLENIESASITSWIKNKIEKIDDAALKEFDIKQQIGAYAVKAKYLIIKFLDEKEKEENRNRINQLQEDLYTLAKNAGIGPFPLPGQIPLRYIIPPMDQFQGAKKLLGPKDFVTLQSKSETYHVDKNSNELISDILPEERDRISTGDMDMTLLVRKPDMLGNALWEFKHGKTPITAHIQDEDWLSEFRSGRVIVKPGTSLRCTVRYQYEYDNSGALLSSRHEIIKVHKVIDPENRHQPRMLDL